MKETPRRVRRVLFALAGAGSALFVHFLPAPERPTGDAHPGSVPAALSAPRPIDAPAPVAVPFAPTRHRAEKADGVPAASPVVAVDGPVAADPAAARTR